MTLAVYLRGVVSEARPLIEEWIGIGEQFAAIRDACKVKGLDWGQIKSLVKAQILDERDNGGRVAKILEKADFASSYAAMLGLVPDDMNENNISGDTSLVREPRPGCAPTPVSGAKEVPAPIDLGGAGEIRPRVTDALPGVAPKKPPASPFMDEDIPASLRRVSA